MTATPRAVYALDAFPFDPRTVMHNLSNHHRVAATPAIADQIAGLRPSDRVRLRGYLVDLFAPGRPPIRTSLSRTDKGSGACEVVYVTELSVEPVP